MTGYIISHLVCATDRNVGEEGGIYVCWGNGCDMCVVYVYVCDWGDRLEL